MAATNTKSKTYIKNVGKSFGYAALDVFEHYNPTLANLYKSSKEAVTEAKRSMKEAKMQLQQAEVESDKGGLSYVLEDLASGKWYNKDREDENSRYLGTIEKEDWGDDTTASAVAETAKDIMKQNEQKTREISSSLNDGAANISKSIGYASAQSAEYIVKSFGAQSRALYSLTSNGFDRVTNVLLSINNSIDGIASMGEGLNTHMRNSAIFYINATQSLSRIDTNIEKLVKMQEAANKSPRGISRKNVKGMENLVDADGNLDLVAYMKMVKDNMDQYKSIAEALKDNKEDWIGNRKGGNMLSNTVVSVVDAMLPKFTKEAMKMMNETLRDAMTAGLTRGGMKARNSKNPIVNILGDMFLPKDGYKDKIDTANYEKGQVAWDGIARKSLVEVIPTYLAKIYAALGGEEKYFDYETGKFVKMDAIKQGHEYDKKVAAVRAGGKMRTDILEDIRKNAPAQRKAQLENEVESFFLQAFIDGYDFVEIASMVNDKNFRDKYGITRESAKYIINYIGAKDVKKARRATGFVAGVARGRNEFGNSMRRKEASGTSNLVYASHDFDGGPGGNAINQFATMTDGFGKTQAYYLRGIYMMTGNIYGALQGQVGGSYRVRPDRRPNAGVYFNPDTGRYSRRRPGMVARERSNVDNRHQQQQSSSANRNNNGITIEDRAKYYGMTDAQILEAKKREEAVKRYQQAFNGQQINPIQGSGEDGQPVVRSNFSSALAKARDIYEAPFAAMTDMINSFTLGINNMFWGTKDKKGLIDKISDYMKNLWTKVFGDENGQGGVGLSQAMKDEWTKIKTKVKDKASSFMGNLGARNRAANDRQVAEAVYNQVTGQSDVPGHARGKQITKTGLIAVSEGELVIPSEFNPYYRGRTNKKQQIKNENKIINRFYGAFATGGTVGGAFSEGQFVEDTDPATGNKIYKFVKPDGTVIKLKNKSEYAKRLAQYKMRQAAQAVDDNTGVITHAKDGVNLLGSGLMDFIKASLFGTEKQQEEDKKKINMKMTDIFKEMGQEKGAMGIGAIGGLGVSLLTGAVVGPLAGAALGAGVGLLAKSEKVQKMLFGEVDENGNYEKEFGNFVMKKLPNIGVTAGLGLVGGTLLGSPILGLIAGSAVGFAGQSESVKKRLFGEMDENGERTKGGLINKELRDKIKKAAPNIAAGGIAGLLVGPFGLAGNLIVGSAIGYLSTGEKFHQYFFGDGKDDKGLAGIIHEKIVKGLDDLIHNTSNAMKGWLRKTGAKIGSKLMSAISKAQNKYETGKASGLTKAIGWAASVPGKALKGATNKVGDLVQGMANHRRARNLAEGYEVWNAEERRNATAAERLAMRSDDDISTAANMDRVIAGADAEQLSQLRTLLTDLRDPKLAFQKVKDKSTATLYSELSEAGLKDKKLMKKIIKEAGSTNSTIRLEELLGGSNYTEDQKKAFRKAFDKSDNQIRAAKDTKTATKGNLALLKDKFGINLEGANNADIANYLKLIDYDDKQRFGEDGSDLNAKEEKYQDNVVTLLTDMNNNISLFTEYITGKRNAQGRYDGNIDKQGNAHFFRHGETAVDADEAIAGARGQRDILEFGRDTKTVIAETTTKVIDTVTDPIKEAVVNTFEFVKEKVVTPLSDTVKAVAHTASDLYGIGVKGFNEANPNIDTSDYYGPTSGIDVVNTAQRTATRVSYLGGRLKRGAGDVIRAIRGKAEGGTIDGTPNNTFLDLLADKVIEKVGGIADYIKGKSGAGEKEEKVTTQIDSFGNVHKYTTNNQGETVEATNDSTTKKSKAIMDKFMTSVNSIPGISTAIGGMSGMFGALKDKLLGGDEEKGPGLLETLVNGLFDDTDGFIPNIISFFTGGKTGGKFGGSTIGSVFRNFIAPALLIGGFSGLFDNAIKEATDGAYGKKDNEEYYNKETGEVVTKTEDGTYVDANGNVVEGQVGIRQNDVANFSDKLKENTARGILTNTSSVASKVLGNTNAGRAISSAATTVVKAVSGDAAAMASITDTILDACIKFTNMLGKIPALKGIAGKIDDMGLELAEKISTKLASSGAKSVLNAASNLVIWAKVAFIVVDFTTGYEDARTTLGIIDEPTVPQKIIAGLLRALKNLIPVVGSLIPDSLVIDVFCKYIAPFFGIEPEGLMKQREEAEAKVAEYNAEHGTNYSVGEYNKAVLKDYTWTERIGNAAKSTVNDVKDKWNAGVTAIKEKGLGGAIKEGFQQNVDIFKQSYAEKGGGIFGAISAGGDVLANMLPGVFGEIAQKNAEITALATKGDLGGMWKVSLSDFSKGAEGEANVGIFSKIIGQIPLIYSKITKTPLALVSKFIGPVIEKVGDSFKGLIESGKYLLSLPATVAADTKELVYSDESSFKDFFNVSKYEQQGENGFFNGIIKAVAMTSRVASLGTMLVGAVGKRIGKFFGQIKDKVVNIGSAFISLDQGITAKAKEGNIGDMFAYVGQTAEDPENPLGFVGKVYGYINAAMKTPLALVSKAGKAIGSWFGKIKDKVITSFTAMATMDQNITARAKQGNIGDMFSYVGQATSEDAENPLGFVGKVYGYINAVGKTPLALVSKAGSAISSWFTSVKDKVVTSITTMATMDQSITAKAKEGDIGGMFDYVSSATSEDAENPLGFVGKVYGYINAAGKVPLALISKAGSAIGGWFTEKVDAFKSDMTTLDTSKEALKTMSQDSNSSIGDIMGYTTQFNENNVFRGIFNAIFGFQKIFYGAAKLLGGVFDAISGVVDGIKDKVSGVVDGITEKVSGVKDAVTGKVEEIKEGAANAWNSAKETVSGWGEAAWDGIKSFVTGSGSGFVSQYDPRYQNYKVSGQNFAAKGCGPAVAAMAGRALGKNISVSDAVSGSMGYQNAGGVSIDYFQNMLGSKGINTRYISGGSSADLYNSIANGEKVVLLGRDPHNTSKENSPFGPNNHYVLATGLDRRGNVIINDPESKGPRAYSPAILNSAKFGVAGSNSGIGRKMPRNTILKRVLSGGSSYDSPIAQQVWAFFIDKGYSPECTAGIMGNMYAESTMNPTTIQGGGRGPAAGICQWENYNTQSGRWRNLYEYAKGNGKSWTDLNMQLNFVHMELTTSGMDKRLSGETGTSNFNKVHYPVSKGLPYAQWKVCKDIEQACYLFEIAFERAGKPNMEKRIKAAVAYYNLYSGSSYSYDPSSADSSGSTSDTPKLFSNIWNVVGDIGTVFSNAFGKVFNKNDKSDNQERQVYGNNSTGSSKALIATGTAPTGDIANNFPYFGQGEEPWAKEPYGQGTIKSSGCGPTSMAMVAKSYGINTDPDRLADWSVDNGHRIPNQGTSWAFFPAAAEALGLNADQFSAPAKAKEYLNQGIPVIGSMKPGDFTKGGHYIVFSGLKDKRVFVNDPASRKRTGSVWDVDSAFSQSKQFWAISNKDGTGSIDNSKLSAAGSGLVSYEDLANMSGGSSGILMKARPGSRNNMPVRTSNGKLVPVTSFTGGATDMITSQTQAMLTNLSKNASRSSGIDPKLVTQLIASITQILEKIANNTAPVSKIYQALVAYVQAGGDSGIKNDAPTPIKVDKTKNNQAPEPEVDSSIATLVGVLAELAKG